MDPVYPSFFCIPRVYNYVKIQKKNRILKLTFNNSKRINRIHSQNAKQKISCQYSNKLGTYQIAYSRLREQPIYVRHEETKIEINKVSYR